MSTKISVRLKQFTPLLHFQGQEEGACLRASEVKPALDRFIRYWIEKNGATIPEQWISSNVNGHIALRYRMTFRANGESEGQDGRPYTFMIEREINGRKKVVGNIHKLFFAAMGQEAFDSNSESRIKGVFYQDGMNMDILVTCSEGKVELNGKQQTLAELINDLLVPFFMLHNFGNRSNKGFGSFGVLEDNNNSLKRFQLDELAKYAPCGCVYYSTYNQNNLSHKDYLDDVFMLSQLFKAGLNLTGPQRKRPYYKGMIFTYYLEKNPAVHSEKAFIKQEILRMRDVERRPVNSFRFVRGIIGLPQLYEFRREGTVRITHDDILRYENPIHFKPFGRYLLIIPQIIPSILKAQNFEFSGRVLGTPESFDLCDFLDYCMRKYNDERGHENSRDNSGKLLGKFTAQTENNQRPFQAEKEIYWSLLRINQIQKSKGR